MCVLLIITKKRLESVSGNCGREPTNMFRLRKGLTLNQGSIHTTIPAIQTEIKIKLYDITLCYCFSAKNSYDYVKEA